MNEKLRWDEIFRESAFVIPFFHWKIFNMIRLQTSKTAGTQDEVGAI